MFNFSIPAVLKAYIDQIVRIRVTVTPQYEGLLRGKKSNGRRRVRLLQGVERTRPEIAEDDAERPHHHRGAFPCGRGPIPPRSDRLVTRLRALRSLPRETWA
jgi:hypothetical protein